MNIRVATKSERFVNFLLDRLIFFPIAHFYILCLTEILKLDSKSMHYSIFTNVSSLILYFFYCYLSELYTSKTPAKYITRTKVISDIGEKPTNKAIFIRNLSRFIPFDVLSFLGAGLGWHDSFSKTLVVEDKSNDE